MQRTFLSLSLVILLGLVTAFSVKIKAQNCGDSLTTTETLHYNVMFKWGLINKKAGSATLSLAYGPTEYHARLTAASASWADRIYRVRDTLNGRMTRDNFQPLFYEKIAHEGGEFKHDIVNYDYNERPGTVIGRCIRRVYHNDRLDVDETRELEAEGKAIDMLTSFYYMRNLPFEDMETGAAHTIEIFSGKQKETLTIRYAGRENVKIGDISYPAYHVIFLFTSKGGSKSSDDMDAWISAADDRIPLKLSGKLPVGKVHCLYAGGNE